MPRRRGTVSASAECEAGPEPEPDPAEEGIPPSWFHQLFGFAEGTGPQYRATQARFELREGGTRLRSRVNGQEYAIGTFGTIPLRDLRARAIREPRCKGRGNLPVVRHIEMGDIMDLHAMPENEGALFQAASQFNCLEMAHPGATPESGVTIYESDATQGPACALACAAATVYRNYLVPVPSSPAARAPDNCGQTADCQLDTLDDLSARVQALANDGKGAFWSVKNGYTDEAAPGCLQALKPLLGSVHREELMDTVKVTRCERRSQAQ
jgi:hypothetical protein